MAQVIININHRDYPISCENGEEGHIIRLGRMLDEKAQTLTKNLGPINENMLLAMTGLLLADELNDLKKTMATAPVATSPTPTPTTSIAAQPAFSEQDLKELDTTLSENINSLNEAIKSIALKLKSL